MFFIQFIVSEKIFLSTGEKYEKIIYSDFNNVYSVYLVCAYNA